MRIYAYAPISIAKILNSLGKVEYSYSIVLRAFKIVLDRMALTIVVEQPEQVDAALVTDPTEAVFLSFTPPHLTRLAQRCPTVPVFAWEFDAIPTDAWYEDETQDWRTTLRRCGSAIVHSNFTAQTVRAAMGEEFPVAALPAPVWDDMEPLRSRRSAAAVKRRLRLGRAVVLDTADGSAQSVWPTQDEIQAVLAERDIAERSARPPLLPYERQSRTRMVRTVRKWREDAFGDVRNGLVTQFLDGIVQRITVRALPRAMRPRRKPIKLDGVIFTTVFNPRDGRKNWSDILSAFCEAHRDHADAVLVMKLSNWDCADMLRDMMMQMARTRPFKCRVLIIQRAMKQDEYFDLIDATSYVVNASHGEGQCLPLMEFMAAGRPAIAPLHTGMLDYIADDDAFIVRTWLEPTTWPHDPRIAYRTLRHQIDWPSLVEAYQRAYDVAKSDPATYRAMGDAAIERTRQHCSQEVVQAGLMQFLTLIGMRKSNVT